MKKNKKNRKWRVIKNKPERIRKVGKKSRKKYVT